MSIISTQISKAVAFLSREDVVAIPTETVYGLAGNIYSEKAIRKIFEVKQRPFFNPLIVHVHSMTQLGELVTEIPRKAQLLADAFWPGPLTLVLKKKPTVPDLITANKDTVALRMPNHPIALRLLKELPFPIAAPSANPFNRISPTSALHVEGYFKDSIPMVLDGGECKNGLESTIVGFENEEPIVYRLGAISVEELEGVIGGISVQNNQEKAPSAPGMLAKHYSPLTKTYLTNDIEEFISKYQGLRIGLICFSEVVTNSAIHHVEVLSVAEDLAEAASKFYLALHKLDELDLDMIVAQRFPDTGLGRSINDRLERAAK